MIKNTYGSIDPMTNSGIASEPLQLADDEYFVLGDNREISLDSRYSYLLILLYIFFHDKKYLWQYFVNNAR